MAFFPIRIVCSGLQCWNRSGPARSEGCDSGASLKDRKLSLFDLELHYCAMGVVVVAHMDFASWAPKYVGLTLSQVSHGSTQPVLADQISIPLCLAFLAELLILT